MIFFTQHQVKEIHRSLINATGGIDGIRDEGLLDSALHSPFQTFNRKELYVDIIDKAAQLCYALIQNHPFIDGNKRIGVHVMLIFLELNNKKMIYTQKDLVDLGLGIASGEITRNKIKQ
ncbi:MULTISPECIES: type II toxin-antitoxin system death-on-curing family toxin [unclassified Treponema]|nr:MULTISPECIES: type II toxin-antitoxin system death-on-curing family toxin [unclassified Treponema]UTC67283.1 type II toxin-antitoxin system death-on-curing family toxin [Treponema sp. OMZ 789]UTC70011.1 type II toxin-antitoxin system death-on-curing family toxin [Treponema sp. OMZ 790]UTC72726.1 type II toxin-antitoxin system death-on-curing family toxin [Treponema sp. OMZ 791]